MWARCAECDRRNFPCNEKRKPLICGGNKTLLQCQPILIRSSAAVTSATRNRTALPSLKYGIRPDNRLQPMTLLPTFIYPPI